jgi:membrane-bound serine protease (ClpP class)
MPGVVTMEIETMQTLGQLLTNPNVIYILLIIGLWAAASTFYVPGTGLLEALAVVCLVLAIAGLTQQPTNIVGLALIVAAGVLFVVDLKVHSVGLTVVAAVALVLGSIFLFPATEAPSPGEASVVRLSPWLIAGVTLVSLGFFGVAVSAVARAQRLTAKVSTAQIVGQRGRAVTALAPLGTVQVGGELWSGVADHDVVVDAGDEVEVVAIDGLKLLVKRVDETEP